MSNIKINDVFQRIQYSATNGQTQFSIPFPFFSNSYVVVWQDGVVIAQGAGAGQYGITGAGSPSGGLITLVTPATLASIITIEGIMPIDRTSIYSATISNLTGSDLNGDFNREVVMMKQIQTTQALLQLQYAPWAEISQDETVTKDRYIPLLPALGAWRMNAGATAIETFLTPASGTLAPGDATYILQTPDSDLPNAQAMSALGSGLVVGTTGTGVLLTRTLTGTANQIALTFGSGIGGDPVVAIAANPILPGTEYFKPPQGTTAQRPGSPTDGMVRYNTDLSALEVFENSSWDTLSGGLVDTITGTANQITIDNTDPANPIIALADNVILPGTAGETLPSGTTAQRAGGSGTIRFNSQTLEFEGTVDGIAWNSFQTSAGTILSVSGTANRITVTAGVNPVVDIAATYVGQTSITTLGTIATGAWEGTDVGILYGGTGVSAVTTAPTASAWAGWDANSNASASAFIEGFQTTASAGATTTLTVASKQIQELTGALTQTYQMPVTSTLVAGMRWMIINNSSGVATVNSSGGNLILSMAANTTAWITCVLNSGTTAASWNSSYVFDLGAGVISITGTANQVIASASTGAVTLSLPQSIASTSSPTFAGLTLTNPYIAGAGGLHSFQIFTSGTAQTYTRPANVTSILVELWGGGGGGGGVAATASSTSSAGGGGAGGYARLYVASAASSYTYTVGGGGAGGTAGANNGTSGTTTTFSASSLQATGGVGGDGTSGVLNTSGQYKLGGAGGVGTNGNVNANGAVGGGSSAIFGIALSGYGASSPIGGGGNSLNTSGTGNNATVYASGGSGALTGAATNRAGGNGSAGLIIVWEFA